MNTQNKLGTESILKLLISLAIPSIMAQIVNVIYNMVDRIYIGKMADGVLAMSALSVCLPVVTTVMAVTMLFGSGGAPLAAIKMGQGDKEGANKVLTTSFVTLVTSAVLLTLIIQIFARPILFMFGADVTNIDYAVSYVKIYSLGTLFVQIATGLNAYITTQGFAKFSMATVMIGAVLNIILDPIFIFGLNMGVKGAALATILAQSVSAIWVMIFFYGKKSNLKIKRKYFKIDFKILFGIMALGVSPFIMSITESFLQISYNNQLLLFGGTLAVGTYAVLLSMYQMIVLTVQGICQGAQPILSYNYGAENYSRVRKTFKLLLIVSLAFTLIAVSLVITFPGLFAGIFTNDETSLKMASWALIPYLGGCLIYGLQISCQQSFLALGQAKRSLSMAVFRKVILLIPLIYILPSLMGESNFAINAAKPIEDLVNHGGKVFAVLFSESISDVVAALTTFTMFLAFYKKYLCLPDKEKK